MNERTVVDVYSDKAKNGSVTVTRDGKEHKIVMRQGTRTGQVQSTACYVITGLVSELLLLRTCCSSLR